MIRIGLCDDDVKSGHESRNLIEKFLTDQKYKFEIYNFSDSEELYRYFTENISDGKIQQKSRNCIAVMEKGRKMILRLADIQYLEREERSTLIVCANEMVKSTSGLTRLDQQLWDANFIRCHNSYIVNLNFVKEYCRNELVLRNGKKIPISRGYLSRVRRAFARFLGEDLY